MLTHKYCVVVLDVPVAAFDNLFDAQKLVELMKPASGAHVEELTNDQRPEGLKDEGFLRDEGISES